MTDCDQLKVITGSVCGCVAGMIGFAIGCRLQVLREACRKRRDELLCARQELAKRAPSPDWIKARIDQLPEHDPWLDDQYDWDLR